MEVRRVSLSLNRNRVASERSFIRRSNRNNRLAETLLLLGETFGGD